MPEPHASWARIYDEVYEQSFGACYDDLTCVTIETISNAVSPPARIVDFGAGTGRLSIPLSSKGYSVLAVEPCKEMLDQLTGKSGASHVEIFNGTMQEFKTDTSFDMAICVFTVLLYLLDEKSLKKSIQAAVNALVPDGLLLIDIPGESVFRSYRIKTQIMDRSVSISETPQDDIYQYAEHIHLNLNGRIETYTDNFKIKYWNKEKVMQILVENGFSVEKNLHFEFDRTGSEYFLMKKG